MNRHKHIFSFVFTVVSVPLVLAVQELCSDKQYSLKNYMIISLIILIAGISAWIEYSQYKTEKETAEKEKVEKQNERAKMVLSQIVQLIDRKAGNIRENTYELLITTKEWPYFYGVHKYLHEVCENLKFTIAKIIKAENDYVDVSLIYKYYGEKEWKWLAGKSGVSGAVNLNEFINDPKTLYSYILLHKDETPLFCNDKSKSKIYKLGRRDNLFGGKGSFYAMPITFSNNQEALVEAILLISTYGVNFIALNSTKDEENEFRRILAYEVVPYYVSIIQSELGALYMRHNINRIRRFSLEDN